MTQHHFKINKDTKICISIAAIPGNFGATVHNSAFQALGLNYCYIPFGVTELEDAIRGIRALGICGCGVSMPYKTSVMALLDKVEPEAALIGSVNTIVNENGILTGYNTDAYGIQLAIKQAQIPRDISVLVVGAGGISKAIIYTLKFLGFQNIYISNRTSQHAERLVDQFKIKLLDFNQIDSHHADFLINATSVGMKSPHTSIFLESSINHSRFVMDVPTSPMKTQLIKLGEKLGKKTIPGYVISLYQAARQFELYTQQVAPLEPMKIAMQTLLNL